MKKSGFTFTEIIVSTALFIIAVLPLVELNRELLRSERRYVSIEHSRKNSEALEKQLRGRGYKILKNNLGKYTYEFKEGEKILSSEEILKECELPFSAEKNEKFEIDIQTLEQISPHEKETLLYIKTIYYGKYKNFKTERIITEYEEYYNEE